MMRMPLIRSVAIALALGVVQVAHANLTVDDFSTPTSVLESSVRPNNPFQRPSGNCTAFGNDPPRANPCVAGSLGTPADPATGVVGGNRDVFAALLQGTTGGMFVTAGDGAYQIEVGVGKVSYTRIEWDGYQDIADDSVAVDGPGASISNRHVDLPWAAGNPNNPFNTPDAVTNPDTFFGVPRRTGAPLLSGGLDSDAYDGKLDHSTVDKIVGLGGVDITEGKGIADTRFLIQLLSTDLVGSFRFTLYSAQDEGSYYDGSFVSGQAEIEVPLSDFIPIPNYSGGQANPSGIVYAPADFTSVTAIVFELLNETEIDARIAGITITVPVPASAALLLLGLGGILVTRRRRQSRV